MSISAIEAERAVIRAREIAIREGVQAENLDATASVIATIELLTNGNSKTAVQNSKKDFQETFAEWADRYLMESHYDRFLAVAIYLREQKQVMGVNSANIGQLFDKARWSKPKNFADVFAKAAQKRLFVESDDTSADGKLWQVTRTGYDYFQSLAK